MEGCSVRTTDRLIGLHRDTILALLVKAGQRCERLLEDKIQAVPVKRVQADEMWGYVRMKEKHKKGEDRFNPTLGDAYIFLGIEADTKLV